jgi:hypothetical protein
MKIALCFLISYKHILNKEQLWIDWIKPNKDIINVYFHYKNYKLIKSDWIKQHCIPLKYIQNTSYYNVVPAYISVMNFAFHHDINNMWFSMLTESCVPIISPQQFRKLFLDHYQASIIKCGRAYWNIDIHTRANLRYLKADYHLVNEPWFTLTRSHVQKTMLFVAANNYLYNQIINGGLANESIFAIILKTFKQINNPFTHINEINTIADWNRMSSPTSPYLFKDGTNEDILFIEKQLKENKYALFLRKVDVSFPDTILNDFIYNFNYEHTYRIKHNQLKKKNITNKSYSNCYKFFNILLVTSMIYCFYHTIIYYLLF